MKYNTNEQSGIHPQRKIKILKLLLISGSKSVQFKSHSRQLGTKGPYLSCLLNSLLYFPYRIPDKGRSEEGSDYIGRDNSSVFKLDTYLFVTMIATKQKALYSTMSRITDHDSCSGSVHRSISSLSLVDISLPVGLDFMFPKKAHFLFGPFQKSLLVFKL